MGPSGHRLKFLQLRAKINLSSFEGGYQIFTTVIEGYFFKQPSLNLLQ